MSYRINVPAKTLPVDEAHLLSGLEHQLHRLQQYRRPLLVGFAVLFLAAGIVGGVFWMDRQAAKKAEELEREATRFLMFRSTGDPKNADNLLKQAIAKYREVIDQYPRSPSAPLALFHLGNAQVLSNDLRAAIETYQRFLVLYGSNPSLTSLAQQRLAYTYLLKGDRDQAAKVFTENVHSPMALDKDQALFELARLDLKYQDQVFNLALRLLENQDAAEDVTQDAFILAFQKNYQFHVGAFRAWLFKIATNLCYDQMRKWRRHPQQSLEPIDKDGKTNESPYWQKDSNPLPEDVLETSDLRNILEHGLSKLPLNFRAVVTLVDVHQMNDKDASSAIGISMGTLKSRLSRGRMQLRNSTKY